MKPEASIQVHLMSLSEDLPGYECSGDCGRFGGVVPGWKLGSSWDWVPCPIHQGPAQGVSQ